LCCVFLGVLGQIRAVTVLLCSLDFWNIFRDKRKKRFAFYKIIIISCGERKTIVKRIVISKVEEKKKIKAKKKERKGKKRKEKKRKEKKGRGRQSLKVLLDVDAFVYD
jgi:hypothetical protein